MAIIDPNKSYTFSDYFKLNCEPEDVLAYFHYQYATKELTLPSSERQLERLDNLKIRLKESLPYISLNNETARREFLIAPVLMELIYYTKAKVKVGYLLNVNEQLKGELDYYLQTQNQLLVIEAKNADLQKGFTQLAVEMIAIEQGELGTFELLYGAVSIGNIWQFAVLDRHQQQITQDLNLYRVPADLPELFKILVGILEMEN